MADRPSRNPETAHRSYGEDGGLVVVPSRSEVNMLNPVGTLIYSKLDGQHTKDQIVQAIVDEYEVSSDQARKDLDDFLAELRSQGMLSEAQEDPA